jgi:predicted nucleotidyltransferase
MFKYARDLVGAPVVMVVVAQHRKYRRARERRSLGHDCRLIGVAVGGQVARQQDEIAAAVEPGERPQRLVTVVRPDVHVSGRGDPHAASLKLHRHAPTDYPDPGSGSAELAMAELDVPFSRIQETLKRVVSALDEADVPFLIGGSLASWARGGPNTTHDLDVIIRPADAKHAQQALVRVGMRAEDPPETWLLKAWDGDVLIDLIHHPAGLTVDDELIERADWANVAAMDFRVMAIEDVLFTKLNALNEHYLDFSSLLQIARAVREQVDWTRLRERTDGSPYATAFFCLLDELGILESTPTTAR